MYHTFSGDSCTLCDHMAYGLKEACQSSCYQPSRDKVAADGLAHIMPLVLV